MTYKRRLFPLIRLVSVVLAGLSEIVRLFRLAFRSHGALAAENLFLRKQLAFYRERQTKPRRLTDSARLLLVFWSRWFTWTDALVVVKPETLLGWHRRAFQLFWRWKSRGGRPRLPRELRALIVEIVRENPTWGQARVAAELALKLGISLSPRTVRAYWPDDLKPSRKTSQRWKTFVRNHAHAIVACDFVITVTASFRILYVFVVMEIGSRKLLHVNVTPHPTSSWTLQQLREAIPSDHPYRWLIHDRSGIFAAELDWALETMGIRALKTPVGAPKANAYCERLIGSLRRECLDWFIPLNERHVRRFTKEWMIHYNRGRPHLSLGPGIPDPPEGLPATQMGTHNIPAGFGLRKKAVLGGLHHEYRLERMVA
jgi:transposase InsO family protein